ncbi:11869_t:CDS:2, partial [Dentiscutata erythropus]
CQDTSNLGWIGSGFSFMTSQIIESMTYEKFLIERLRWFS